jgi:hypothetical protein
MTTHSPDPRRDNQAALAAAHAEAAALILELRDAARAEYEAAPAEEKLEYWRQCPRSMLANEFNECEWFVQWRERRKRELFLERHGFDVRSLRSGIACDHLVALPAWLWEQVSSLIAGGHIRPENPTTQPDAGGSA